MRSTRLAHYAAFMAALFIIFVVGLVTAGARSEENARSDYIDHVVITTSVTTTTETTVIESTTIDVAAVIEYATALYEATSTTLPPPTTTTARRTPVAPKQTPTTSQAPHEEETGPVEESEPSQAPSLPPFLVCVRQRESGGNYQAYNRSSGASGAFQFLSGTARSTANHAGRPDLANVPVLNWSPADQDAMAIALYQWQGASPWASTQRGC